MCELTLGTLMLGGWLAIIWRYRYPPPDPRQMSTHWRRQQARAEGRASVNLILATPDAEGLRRAMTS